MRDFSRNFFSFAKRDLISFGSRAPVPRKRHPRCVTTAWAEIDQQSEWESSFFPLSFWIRVIRKNCLALLFFALLTLHLSNLDPLFPYFLFFFYLDCAPFAQFSSFTLLFRIKQQKRKNIEKKKMSANQSRLKFSLVPFDKKIARRFDPFERKKKKKRRGNISLFIWRARCQMPPRLIIKQSRE